MLNVNNINAQVTELGREHGRNVGSWVIDGDTSEETCREILQAIEDGDPGFEAPAPLSGEWADWPTPQTLADDLELDEEHRGSELDQICTDYELAYYEAWQDEVVRSARAMLGL